MSDPKPPKRRLKKDDLKTFSRLFVFAKPYWWRLAVGAVTSALGGGSIIALFVVAQQLLSFLVDNHQLMDDDSAPPAFEQVVADGAVAAEPPAVAAPAPEPEPAAAVDASVAETAAAAEAAEDPPAAKKGYFDRKARELSSRLLGDKQKDLLLRKGLEGLVDVSLLLLLVIVVNSVCQFLSMYYLQWVGQRVVMDLREAIFAHLQRLSVSFYNSQRAGDMISRTVADTQLLQTTVSNVITDAIRQPLTLLMVLVFVVVIEWKLALFALVLVPTVVVPIVLIGRRLRRISREGQVRLAELTSVMKEALDGVAVVKAFGQEERMEGQFNRLCHGFFRQMIRATKAKCLNDPITHIVGGLGGMGVLVYAMVAGMPLEECIIFAGAIWALYEPVKKIGRISMEIQQSSGAADRVFEILDAPVTVVEAPDARPLEGPLSELELRGVAFRYGEKPVFDRLDLTIRAGESLAVVGPSGGGKTTLVSLLLRFFDPDSGAVLRNGVDIRGATFASLRSRIGLVLQDTFLFNDTIAANIAFGKPDATREEIEEAARLAHADEFIRAKENGYDTMVGERGVSLSGGQKQRIAIARALIRKPELLILDEATSALDTDSERAVQAAIDDLMGRLTVVVIAHRLSTIAKCRHVAVVANGGVAEYGTQAELLRNPDGIFTHLHTLQFEAPPAV